MRLHQATWWFPSRDSRGNTWSNQCRSLSSKTLHTYPLSACADERSFSSMKRIKTSLRNTMTDERLSSLAILHIHNFDKDANVDNVAKFAHQKERRQKMVWWRDDRKPCFFISLCTQDLFFDVLLFHVHSTVPFFSKLVIPVHVSMEEPVLKTKAEKSTSVNVVVDGEETIAKKRRLQVPSKFRNVLHYTFVAFKKYRDLHRPHIKVLSSIYHTWAVNSIILRCNLQGQNTKTKNPSKPLNTVRDIKRTRREVKEVTWTDLLNQRSMFLAQRSQLDTEESTGSIDKTKGP